MKNIMTKSKNHSSKRTLIENRQFSCQLIQRYHGKISNFMGNKMTRGKKMEMFLNSDIIKSK